MALIHHQHAVCLCGFFHVVGNGDHGDAVFVVQAANGFHHRFTASRVQHGGGFIQHQTIGPHGDHARNGHALLLAARKLVRALVAVLVNARHLHGIVNAGADLFGIYPQIFQRKGHIFLYHRGHDLVVGVLKHHAHLLANGQQIFLVFGVHFFHQHRAGFGQKNGVKVFGQRGFSAAVCAQNGHKLAFFHFQAHPVQRKARLLGVIAEVNILRCQHCFRHKLSPSVPALHTKSFEKAGSGPHMIKLVFRVYPGNKGFILPKWRLRRRAQHRRWRLRAGRSHHRWCARRIWG